MLIMHLKKEKYCPTCVIIHKNGGTFFCFQNFPDFGYFCTSWNIFNQNSSIFLDILGFFGYFPVISPSFDHFPAFRLHLPLNFH